MCQYKLFLSATDKKIVDNAKLRVDLYGNMKLKEIKELKGFNVRYISKGHNDLVLMKGQMIPRKIRYIQIFKK